MQTPKNKSGEITEKIMKSFSKFEKNAVIVLDTDLYNEIYFRVYSILEKHNKNLENCGDPTCDDDCGLHHL